MAAFGETLAPIVDRLVADLPEGLAPHGQVLTDGVGAVVADGNPEALFSPEGIEAQAAVGRAVHDGCEVEQVDVVARDFSFEGIGDELPAGRLSFAFANDGTEEHEMIVLRRHDASDATLEELAADPGALFAEAAFTGVVFAAPGETGYTALDLDEGTYFLVCTIPTGGDPAAEPHAAHGMLHTVEVV